MVTFIIKSSICLIIFYGFFHFFLRYHKILLFNRFYLMFSLLFSMLIPQIIIPINSNFTLTHGLDKLTILSDSFITQEKTIENGSQILTFDNILISTFLIISSVLLLRFCINIFRIIRKASRCKKIDNQRTSLVLVDEKTLPYSFFRYVFVNKTDFENGKIENELLIHEEAHCLQYHSIDIIILELINIVLWFNPAIWLFRKAIHLNHEYYADNKVIANSEFIEYHQLLLNLLLKNNSNFLTSNFKYSQIINRIIMMTKSRPSKNAIFRKIGAFSLFFLIGIAVTISQENNLNGNFSNLDNEWLKPILQKHSIDLRQFNYKNVFVLGSDDSLSNVCFEIGSFDSQMDRLLKLKNAILIFKGKDSTYGLITATNLSRDLDKNIIEGNNGKIESYKLEDINPINTISYQEFKQELKIILDSKSQKHFILVTTTR